MISLKNFLNQQLNEARIKEVPTSAYEELSGYFDEVQKGVDDCGEDGVLPIKNWIKTGKEIYDWCLEYATELGSFKLADTKYYTGVIIMTDPSTIKDDPKYQDYFALVTFNNNPKAKNKNYGYRVTINSSRCPDGAHYDFGFRRLERYDIMDVNRDKNTHVFVVDDEMVWGCLDKNFKAVMSVKNNGDSNDPYMEEVVTGWNLEKALQYTGDRADDLKQLVLQDTMKADDPNLMNTMKTGKFYFALGVNDSGTVFTFAHGLKADYYYEQGMRMNKSFKTQKIFKEFFTPENMEKLGVTEIRFYKKP